MKNLIFCTIASLALVSLAGCSCDKDKQTTTSQSASMQTDTKNMQSPSH